jgi:hypothetical protein
MPFRYDSTYWQERAHETRRIAEGMRDQAAKQTMLHIAEDYDQLAARSNGIATTGHSGEDCDLARGSGPAASEARGE